jgi:hypothetical protein
VEEKDWDATMAEPTSETAATELAVDSATERLSSSAVWEAPQGAGDGETGNGDRESKIASSAIEY